MTVALFDYGVGNLHSLAKALTAAGASVRITRDWPTALAADALVLPGVGAFGAAVEALPADRAPIREALDSGLPCLGICLGMQILCEGSAEGDGAGIGHFAGRVRALDADVVPHMGWNEVEMTADPLFRALPELTAYHAHSFVCQPADPACVIARTRYDRDHFPAAIRRGATWGVQFHPEKSSFAGRRLITNFLAAATVAAQHRRHR